MQPLKSCMALPGAMLLVLCFTAGPGLAGPVNPDISVIGQPLARWTDDPGARDRRNIRLDAGETEIVFDAYLNPYAKGYVVASLGESGLELEEGFFTMVRGLPANLALKGGQYRVGFGKLNPQHPHMLPFADRFGVLAACLPGEESFHEVGIDLSRRFPIVGDFSVTAAADYLQGDMFRMARTPSEDPADPLNSGGNDDVDLTRPAVLGRLSGFAMVGEQSAVEFGLSAAHGTNNVAAGARTTVVGGDVKAKLWNSPRSYVVVQSELLWLDRQEASWLPGSGYSKTAVKPFGGYVYADYNFALRYNAGASYERFQEPVASKPVTQSVGAFAGLALLEETTTFRLDWRRVMPESGSSYNTVNLRVIYSMGPHKAHQF